MTPKMKCICCNSEQVKKKFKKKSYQLFECNLCGFQFIDPLPSQSDIKAHYNKTRISKDLRKRIKASLNDFNNNPNCPKRDWFARIVSTAQHHLQNENLDILEIGSGIGHFIDYCNNKEFKAVGTEVTKDFANSSKGLINGDIVYIENDNYDFYFKDRKFDLIYLEHVFEHVLHPAELLQKMDKLLADQGIIILIVPNHKSLLARIFGRYYKWTNPPDHLYFHNINSLKSLTEKEGFTSVEYWTDDYYHRSIYQFYSLDVLKFKFYSLLNKLFNLKMVSNHTYKYPRNFSQTFTLLPYLILYPFIKLLNRKYNMGNELTMVLKRNPPPH